MFTRTSRAKRRIGAAVLAALVGSLLAFASPANAGAGITPAASDRLSGANRYATAAAIAQDGAWGAEEAAITVVNGENFPDGLAAAALGNRVLLVTADSIPAETEAAIKALEAALTDGAADADATNDGVLEITIVGGTAVVSDSVRVALDALNGDDGVRRLAGADRYATALAVAAAVNATPANVVLATGTNFPDALAAGPLAIEKAAPIVLNQGASLLPAVRDYMVKATGTIYIVGGEGAIPASVATELTAMGKTIKRLGGATREETAVAIAGEIADGANSAVLVNRNGFADALAAGPFAALGTIDGSIMLVNDDSIPTATSGWHVDNCNTLGDNGGVTGTDAAVYAMGGTGVISASVLTAATAATGCVTPTVTSATVANSDFKQASIELNGNVSGAAGVKLTAVPGSAADGAAGNSWTITVNDAAVASAIADPVAQTLVVNIVVPATPAGATFGLTQQQFVDAWNALGGDATKYFTPSVTTLTGAPSGYDTGTNPLAAASPTGGSQDQTVVVTFNMPVDDATATNAGNVLGTAAFTPSAGTIDAVVSPLGGTVGGATTYTLLLNDEGALANLLVAGTGTIAVATAVPAATAWSTANGLAVATTAVTLTAG